MTEQAQTDRADKAAEAKAPVVKKARRPNHGEGVAGAAAAGGQAREKAAPADADKATARNAAKTADRNAFTSEGGKHYARI
ncbi:MAG: hypothetical protein CR984_06850 [Proteobacteria bacterium]|nr:MAG: hypothetical protein CR984_06850 [Pseudomonadota bacterium]